MEATHLPVFVRIPLPDGTERLTQIGTASKGAEEFVLTLEGLSLGTPEAVGPAPVPVARVVPPLEAPTFDATGTSVRRLLDLEQLAERSRKVLGDEKKARWHQDVRSQLELIEVELARLRSRGGPTKG